MSRPWMPLYVGDYLADTAHLSAAEHGAYLLLIMHYWRQSGLPTDDVALARIARMTPREWQKSKPVIAAFFDDGWKHKRIEFEITESERISAAGKAGGIASGEARRRKSANKSKTETNDRSTTVQRNANDQPTIREALQPQSQKEAAALSAREPVDRIFEAIGVADDPHWYGHKPTVARWLDGWDLELDILPTIHRLMAGRGPPRSPKFFEAAIAEAHAARLAPLPVATVRSPLPHAPENSLVAAGRRRIAELDAIIAAASVDGGDHGADGLRSGDANVRLLPARGRSVG